MEGFGTSRRIYVVGPGKSYASWMNGKLVDKMEDANLVVFTGGEDICPLIYNQTDIHPRTYYTVERDDYELKAYRKALSLGKKMIGICRGHQLLSAMNGAVLIQDQPNPGSHTMTTYKGEVVNINSLHHQAVYPFDLPMEDYSILGYTRNLLSHHQNGKKEEMNPPVEVEAIYFPKTKCLGIQCHPEMMSYLSLNQTKNRYEEALKFFYMTLAKFMADTLEGSVNSEQNNKLKVLELQK